MPNDAAHATAAVLALAVAPALAVVAAGDVCPLAFEIARQQANTISLRAIVMVQVELRFAESMHFVVETMANSSPISRPLGLA
jgi:hypothetical protein